MRKIILIIVISFISTLTFSQKSSEFSASYIYGKFTGDFARGIYEDLDGFNISYITNYNEGKLGVGVFYQQNKSDEGTPYTYGGATISNSEIKFNTYGLSFSSQLLTFLSVYVAGGYVTAKENIDSETEKDNGYSLAGGIKISYPIGEKVKLFVNGEYMSVSDLENANGSANNYSGGLGISFILN